MATPQVFLPSRVTDIKMPFESPAPTGNASVIVTFATPAGPQSAGGLVPMAQVLADIRSLRPLPRSEAFDELAREVADSRVLRDQEDIGAWSNTLADKIIEYQD
jgi:hypothetical protein